MLTLRMTISFVSTMYILYQRKWHWWRRIPEKQNINFEEEKNIKREISVWVKCCALFALKTCLFKINFEKKIWKTGNQCLGKMLCIICTEDALIQNPPSKMAQLIKTTKYPINCTGLWEIGQWGIVLLFLIAIRNRFTACLLLQWRKIGKRLVGGFCHGPGQPVDNSCQ